MSEIIDGNRLIELVIEKHRRFLDTYSGEFSGIDTRLNSVKQQSDAIKKEIDTVESKILVLTEKYHLLFHQAKKQREEIFADVLGKMRTKKADLQEVGRLSGRLGELEKKLQTSRNIEDEEKMVGEMKTLLYEFESGAGKAGIIVTCKGTIDKLNEANSSHRELLSLQDKPKEQVASSKEYEKQISEIEERHNWLKHRIESHNNALEYWEKQKEGIRVG
ncbi:MAG: hypothetical protein FIB08_03495 [Candidatus Methanoperedens sp.]|nr:hypothetical protein [Candidatus Methanoperedens sp.]